jgi:dTDP-L-rhamnose 4-epimerase
MTVLVTGGAGFIGSHLVDLLVERGHDVVVIDNLDPQVHGRDASAPRHLEMAARSGAVRFIRGDVTNRRDLMTAVEHADTVVHLAAAVGVGQSMYAPHYYVHTNATGTGLLLDLIVSRREQVRKLVVASSMSLYGEGAYECPHCGGHSPRTRDEAQLATGRWEVACTRCGQDLSPLPTPETKSADLWSVYAATKKHQEDLFVTFGRAYGIPTFALRFFNVFGARQSLGNPYTGVVAIFLARLLSGKPPLVFEDGRQTRDFIDVRDVAQALLLAVEFEGSGTHVLNVGTGRPLTVEAVALTLAERLGVDLRPECLQRYRVGDIRHCVADPALAAGELGFRARYTLDTGLDPVIDWCRQAGVREGLEDSLLELRRQGLVR